MKDHLNEHIELRFENPSPELFFSLAIVLIVYFFTHKGGGYFSPIIVECDKL